MTELASLAQQLSVSERTLRRAVNQGTLRATRPSPKKLELSLSERGFVRRTWPLVFRLRASLRTEPNVRLALLFGSAAQGTDTATSDVDVLVSLRDASVDRVADLGAKLTSAAGRSVDVVRLEDAMPEPSFLADVVAQGRVLVDRDHLWPALRQRQRALHLRGRARDAQRAQDALAGIDRLLAR